MNKLSRDERIERLVRMIDTFVVARIEQHIAEFDGDSYYAIRYAEAATKMQQLLREQLELML